VIDPLKFFEKKKPWSKYKDLILDYYLEPYLAKVARLRRPILAVDCFAGPGRFDDGQAGSPLIISNKLQLVQERGTQVMGFYVEKNPALYERLQSNTHDTKIPVHTRQGDFRQYISEITELAHDRTVFVYLDPIKPSDLLFTDMECVYHQLQHGRSVEVLINFMSTGFLRAVRGLSDQMLGEHGIVRDSEHVRHWDCVAGGTYWQEVILTGQMSDRDRVDQLARGYAERLNERFDWVISYPIRDKYKDRLPKYHLTFGSRHPDAIELMNRAMVKARREFVGARFVEGCLFDHRPEIEVVRPEEIERVVLATCRALGKTTWKNLRVRTTVAYPCMYTDSEINGAIKRAIQAGRIHSASTGRRIEDEACVWPAP